MKLYEITDQYATVLDMLESGDPEVQGAAQDTLEAIQGEFDDKVDSIACLIKELKAEAEAIKAEKDRLAKREKTKKSEIEWLTGYILAQMEAVGKDKLETARNVVSVRKSAPAVKIPDEEKFLLWAVFDHEQFVRQKGPEIDRAAVKEALKRGVEVPGAYLEQGRSVTIK